MRYESISLTQSQLNMLRFAESHIPEDRREEFLDSIGNALFRIGGELSDDDVILALSSALYEFVGHPDDQPNLLLPNRVSH